MSCQAIIIDNTGNGKHIDENALEHEHNKIIICVNLHKDLSPTIIYYIIR